MGSVDGRVGGGGRTKAKGRKGWGVEVAIQGLLKHMLGCNVGVAKVGRAGARDGRLRAIGEGRGDLARYTSVLGKA